MPFIKNLSVGFVSVAAIAAAGPALAQSTPAASPSPAAPPAAAAPAAPQPTTTVAQALAAKSDLSTFNKLAAAAGLTETLGGAGPVTVFVPDDAAFGRLGTGVVSQLLVPDNKGSAKQIASYHVVQGHYTTQDLIAKLKASGGTLTLDTLDNQPLTLRLEAGAVELTDAKGGKAFISKLSDEESNGVIEYINGVLSPNMTATTVTKRAPAAAGAAGQAAPAATPDTATPDQAAPDTATPDEAAPDTATPDQAAPVATPDTSDQPSPSAS